MLVWLTCKWPMMSLSSQNSQTNFKYNNIIIIIDYLMCTSILVLNCLIVRYSSETVKSMQL